MFERKGESTGKLKYREEVKKVIKVKLKYLEEKLKET